MSKDRRRPRTKPTVKAPSNDTLRSADTELVELSRDQQIRDLGYPLNDVICMAALLSNALNQAFEQDPTPITGNPYWYHFDAPKTDALLFAVRHLERLLRELRSRYEKASLGADV
jgi:hypothetical protein